MQKTLDIFWCSKNLSSSLFYIATTRLITIDSNESFGLSVKNFKFYMSFEFTSNNIILTSYIYHSPYTAEFLHLPLPQPYLNLSDFERSQATTVVNYASGGCGILNTTRAVR